MKVAPTICFWLPGFLNAKKVCVDIFCGCFPANVFGSFHCLGESPSQRTPAQPSKQPLGPITSAPGSGRNDVSDVSSNISNEYKVINK